MATILISVVTWHKEFINSINSHTLSMRWLCEVTWQIKYIMSPLADDPWTLNKTRYWLTARVSHPSSHMTLWSREQRKSRDSFEINISTITRAIASVYLKNWNMLKREIFGWQIFISNLVYLEISFFLTF